MRDHFRAFTGNQLSKLRNDFSNMQGDDRMWCIVKIDENGNPVGGVLLADGGDVSAQYRREVVHLLNALWTGPT